MLSELKIYRVNGCWYTQQINTSTDSTQIVDEDQKVIMQVDYAANVYRADQSTQIGKFSFDDNMNWKFTSYDGTITWRSGLKDLILAERLFFKQYATELFGVVSE